MQNVKSVLMSKTATTTNCFQCCFVIKNDFPPHLLYSSEICCADVRSDFET